MPDWYLDWILEQLKKQKQKEEQKMTTEHALASFESGFSHPDFALTTEGAEAYEIACQAMREKIERENPNPITWEEMKQMNEEPVYIVDLLGEGRTGWHILSWDYRKSGQYLVLSSRHCNGFLSEEYGETWVCYKYKPNDII